MNKSNNILWFIVIGVFVFIMAIWIYIQKPELLKKTETGLKYINFEVVAQSVQPNIIKINYRGVSSYGVIIHPRGYVLTVNRDQPAQAPNQPATAGDN